VSVPGSLEFVDPPALLLFSIALVLLAFGVVSCQGSRLKNSNGILHPTGDQFFQDLEGDLTGEQTGKKRKKDENEIREQQVRQVLCIRHHERGHEG